MMDRLFGKTINMLSTQLNYRAEKHKVISSNLANIDTPDYRPKDLVFKQVLKGAVEGSHAVTPVTTHKDHIGVGSLSGKDAFDVTETGDEVSLDEEMIHLADNHLMYNMTVDLLARKFRTLKSVFTEVK
jgi:flagellar basal-body rod protein FlgB